MLDMRDILPYLKPPAESSYSFSLHHQKQSFSVFLHLKFTPEMVFESEIVISDFLRYSAFTRIFSFLFNAFKTANPNFLFIQLLAAGTGN